MSGRVLEIAEYVLSNIMENVVGASIRNFCVVTNRRAVYKSLNCDRFAAGWVGVQL